MTFLQFAIGDTVVIFLLHLGLLILVFWSIAGSYRMRHDGVSVKRGEKGWKYFYVAYWVLSVVFTQIISVSEVGKGYKVFIVVVDVGTLLYLGFYNSWFRNKIMQFIVQSMNKEE